MYIKKDLCFHMVRRLFADDILENEYIKYYINEGEIASMRDFDDLYRIKLAPRTLKKIEETKNELQNKKKTSGNESVYSGESAVSSGGTTSVANPS